MHSTKVMPCLILFNDIRMAIDLEIWKPVGDYVISYIKNKKGVLAFTIIQIITIQVVMSVGNAQSSLD